MANTFQFLMQHPLASQPLKRILAVPKTRNEKKILESLAKAYENMGNHFPSQKLSADLDDLYSDTLVFIASRRSRIAESAVEHVAQANPQSKSRTLRAWLQRYEAELKPVLVKASRELRFLTLQAAASRVELALEKARQQ